MRASERSAREAENGAERTKSQMSWSRKIMRGAGDSGAMSGAEIREMGFNAERQNSPLRSNAQLPVISVNLWACRANLYSPDFGV